MFAIESEYPKKFQWFSDGKYFPEKNPILLKCELKKKFTAPFVIYFIDIFFLQKLHFKSTYAYFIEKVSHTFMIYYLPQGYHAALNL